MLLTHTQKCRLAFAFVLISPDNVFNVRPEAAVLTAQPSSLFLATTGWHSQTCQTCVHEPTTRATLQARDVDIVGTMAVEVLGKAQLTCCLEQGPLMCRIWAASALPLALRFGDSYRCWRVPPGQSSPSLQGPCMTAQGMLPARLSPVRPGCIPVICCLRLHADIPSSRARRALDSKPAWLQQKPLSMTVGHDSLCPFCALKHAPHERERQPIPGLRRTDRRACLLNVCTLLL